jgi:acylglycerol lipase
MLVTKENGNLMNQTTFTFSSNDGLSLLGRAWRSPHPNPKGIVNLVHGLGEHSGRYAHVGDALTQAGYHLTGFDLRGHGLSEGKRGHTPSFGHLLDDVQRFLKAAKDRMDHDLPIFLYGHSLGGSIAINYGLQRQPDLTGMIVTSPSLALAFEPSKAKIAAAKIMAKLMPAFAMKNGLETEALSRDIRVVKAYHDDVYVHDALSARLGLDMLESGQSALQNAPAWNLPLLLMHGTADRITSHKASQQFAEKAGLQVDLILWENAYHEIHNDLDNQDFFLKMITWLDEKTKQAQANLH